ncbi:MAG: hypothetical protein ACRETP_02100 [Steroidobacteraceae bacterium]
MRYDAANRTIGVHLDLATYAIYRELRDELGTSFAATFRAFLKKTEIDMRAAIERGRQQGIAQERSIGYAEGYGQGYPRGLADASELYEIHGPCARCGGPISLRVGSEPAAIAVDYLTERGWQHGTCPDKSPR